MSEDGKILRKLKVKPGRYAPADDHIVKDGRQVRLLNRRVGLFPVESGGKITHWLVAFRSLEDGRKINKTSLCLTDETVEAIYDMYAEQSPRLNPWQKMMDRFHRAAGALAMYYDQDVCRWTDEQKGNP